MTSFDEFMDAGSQFQAQHGRERIMEILVFLLAEMRRNKQLTEIDLKPLSQRGFNQTEISTAFSWLFDKIALLGNEKNPVMLSASFSQNGTADASRSYAESSFRIYHDVERSVIDTDAQGYLLQIRELGLITDNDLELVIDRIMLTGTPRVTLLEMKELVGSMIFDFDDSNRIGSRMMLAATDRVQ